MFKSMGSLFILFGLVLALATSVASPVIAEANGDTYRIVLRYYDDIQITYELTYPVGSADLPNRTFAQDVPIGGVGVPGAGPFDIDPFIATQIYCVDPYTPFHGNVPGLGGSYQWSHGAMADTLTGYVEAAPWNSSGAVQKYGEAVGWLVANGYRGIYTTTGALDDDDDAESKASVARLNAWYESTVGTINKEIALMATKVAIWKVVAGDENVQIKETTIDGSAKRDIFDRLVSALVNAANNPSLRPSTGVAVTDFSLSISPHPSAEFDETTGATHDFYGPLSVEANLSNARAGADLSDLDKIFLTANGIESSGVKFVSSPDSDLDLATDVLPGTNNLEQYVTGNGAGASWTSNDFYIAIPKGRVPERGDRLSIRAMAMASDVPVAEGTPVVLAFSQGDVQDWDAIQAFIGGTLDGQRVNLYAETELNTGDTSLGELYISKQVVNASEQTANHEFTFRVHYSNDSDFDNSRVLNLTDHPVRGAFSVNTAANTFTLRNGGLALIQDLPMEVRGEFGEYDYYYWVEEVEPLPAGYEAPSWVLDIGNPQGAFFPGHTAGPFRLDAVGTELAFVTVTNIAPAEETDTTTTSADTTTTPATTTTSTVAATTTPAGTTVAPTGTATEPTTTTASTVAATTTPTGTTVAPAGTTTTQVGGATGTVPTGTVGTGTEPTGTLGTGTVGTGTVGTGTVGTGTVGTGTRPSVTTPRPGGPGEGNPPTGITGDTTAVVMFILGAVCVAGATQFKRRRKFN
jgi:hypothetical protein